MKKIFISYRRDDSGDVTGRITDRLRQQFGEESIFTDVDSIPLGVDFRDHLDREVGRCDIFLAIVGRHWTSMTDDKGIRRLDDPADFVRIEVESALQRQIPVVPLLAHGTSMPSADELPESLSELAFRNGLPVRRDPDFHTDMDRVIDGIEKHFKQREQKRVKPLADEQVKSPSVVEQSNTAIENQKSNTTEGKSKSEDENAAQADTSAQVPSTPGKTYLAVAALLLTMGVGGWWLVSGVDSDAQLSNKQPELSVKDNSTMDSRVKLETQVEAKKKAEEEAKRLAKAKQEAAMAAKLKAEVEAKKKAEEEAKRLAKAKQEAAVTAKLKTEAEAKKKAEEEAKRLAKAKQEAAMAAKLKSEAEIKKKAEEAKRLAEAKKEAAAAETKSKVEVTTVTKKWLTREETLELVSGKTVFWGNGDGAYYAPNGKLLTKSEGETDRGRWSVNSKGALCWHVSSWGKLPCQSYYIGPKGMMSVYKGNEFPTDEHREGNHMKSLY